MCTLSISKRKNKVIGRSILHLQYPAHPLLHVFFSLSQIQKWKFIREWEGSADDLMATPEFADVANGGFVMAKSYIYGAAISYTISSTYDFSSEESSNKMSQAVSAGLSASAGAGSGSIKTNVENSMSEVTKNTNLNEKTSVQLKVYGTNIDSNCMKDDNCNKELNQKVDDILKDFNKLGLPYKPEGTVDMDKFVENIFRDGKPGFPQVFKDAVEKYFTVYKCKYPGGGFESNGNFKAGCNAFIETNGAGVQIRDTYCPAYQACRWAQYFPHNPGNKQGLCFPRGAIPESELSYVC